MSQGVTVDAPVAMQASASFSGKQSAVMQSPGYVAPVAGVPVQSMGSTADNSFTLDAEFLLRGTGERIVWQGKPSILCLLPRAIAWSAVILLAAMFAIGLRHGGGWVFIWIMAAGIHIGMGYLNWQHTTYRITSQRVEYSNGVFSSVTAASPISHVGNVTILRPFPWNMLKLGHLELDIPDQAAGARVGFRPKVLLKFIQNLETTRDLIHSSSAISNQLWDQQRYGR